MRQGIAAIDNLLSTNNKNGSLQINASDLIMVLQGKIYEGFTCHSVTGIISEAALDEIRYIIRSKILDLTIQFEKNVSDAGAVTIGTTDSLNTDDKKTVTYLTHQVVFGDITNVNTSGDNNIITVKAGDISSLKKVLIDKGIDSKDVDELIDIVKTERPKLNDNSMGPKVRTWLENKFKDGVDEAWNIGKTVAQSVILVFVVEPCNDILLPTQIDSLRNC